MVDPVPVLKHIPVMGVRLKNQIHVAFGKGDIIVGFQIPVADRLGLCAGGPAVMAVMDGIDDKIRTLAAKLFCFLLDQRGQLRTGLEVKILRKL